MQLSSPTVHLALPGFVINAFYPSLLILHEGKEQLCSLNRHNHFLPIVPSIYNHARYSNQNTPMSPPKLSNVWCSNEAFQQGLSTNQKSLLELTGYSSIQVQWNYSLCLATNYCWSFLLLTDTLQLLHFSDKDSQKTILSWKSQSLKPI